jgi:thioredoxin-like negative regulator of GroEL
MRARGFILVLAAALLRGGTAAGAEVAWTNSYAGALKLALERKTPLLIDFYSESCTWCGKLDREVYETPRAAEALKDLVCLKVDVERDVRTASAFQISSIPRTVIIDPAGRIAADRLGYQPLEDFLRFLEEARKPALRPENREPAPGLGSLWQLDAVRAAAGGERDRPAFSSDFLAFLGHADPAVRAEAARGVREAGAVFTPKLRAALAHPDLGVRVAAWGLLKEAGAPEAAFDPWAPAPDREAAQQALISKIGTRGSGGAP